MPGPLLPPRTQALLVETRERLLDDTCVILARQAGARNAYGYPQADFVPSAPEPCAFQSLAASEIGLVGVGVIQAICYLRPTVAVATSDRVRLTHLRGQALTPPLLFEVAGPPQPQLATVAVRLISVTEQPQPGA